MNEGSAERVPKMSRLEQDESQIRRYIELTDKIRATIGEKYGVDSADPLPYHNEGHLDDIDRRRKKLPLSNVTPRQEAVIAASASYHDLVMNSEIGSKLLDMRARRRGHSDMRLEDGANGNEAASARALLNDAEAAGILTSDDELLITETIDMTYPEFDFRRLDFGEIKWLQDAGYINQSVADWLRKRQVVGPIVTQPKFDKYIEQIADGEREFSPALIQLPLADLGAHGLDEFKDVSRASMTEFREIHGNLTVDKIRQLSEKQEIEGVSRLQVAEKMKDWVESEVVFGAGQALNMGQNTIGKLKQSNEAQAEAAGNYLKEVFKPGRYASNSQGALDMAERFDHLYESVRAGEAKAFSEMAQEMGYVRH